jgi:hypothetical protein
LDAAAAFEAWNTVRGLVKAHGLHRLILLGSKTAKTAGSVRTSSSSWETRLRYQSAVESLGDETIVLAFEPRYPRNPGLSVWNFRDEVPHWLLHEK